MQSTYLAGWPIVRPLFWFAGLIACAFIFLVTVRNPELMTQILMPALSPTMEEGNLAKWLVKVGDRIEPGQVIAEIETDKATMEVEAVDEGTVTALLVPKRARRV